MLLIELNEYNSTLLRRIARENQLDALNRVFSWSRTRTITDDTYDSGYLEPWVQWVSVHTGSPSSTHGIKHLGDVPGLEKEQLWQRWSRAGRRSVVWGVMNGDRRGAENCVAFIPDPWTFSEPAYPHKYRNLIELPRYLARNYLEISKIKSVKEAFGMFRTLLAVVDRRDFMSALQILMNGLRQFGAAHVTFIVFFEYMSAMAFLRAVRDFNPDDAVLFVNMFAHVQHHYWKRPEGENCPQLVFAASAMDDIVRKALTALPPGLSRKVSVMNALSQKCTHDEPAWILHRPINPEKFIAHLGLTPISVEPLMTHDAHLTFASEDEAINAFDLLKRIHVGEKRLMHVEHNNSDPDMVFYRLDFFDEVDEETTFVNGNTVSRFKDHFISIVTRTGKHIPEGEIMSNWDGMPPEIYNHDAASYFICEDKLHAAAS